jgi:hypothetical protein
MPASGSMRSVTPVSWSEMESIMTAMPMTWVKEVTSWTMPVFKVWLSVSTSFVIRESTSPFEVPSPSK